MTKKEEKMESKETFKKLFIDKLETVRGISIKTAGPDDYYIALALLVKDRMSRLRAQTSLDYRNEKRKEVYYFSLEFLLGKMLESNMMALGIRDVCTEALAELGIDMDQVYNVELDPGLGNGGLGRLAACFMDSLAALGLPGNGNSIRYKYGLFQQKLVDGFQVETPDDWLRNENLWEIKKPNHAVNIKFFGNIREEYINGRTVFFHENYETVIAMPYDMSIPGFKNGIANNLRLWSAEAVRQFDFKSFSSGNYLHAVSDKYSAEAISEVLYPDDSNYENSVLRLKQQYFFVSAGIQSIVAYYKLLKTDIRNFHEYTAIHINDTHPALAVPELMRILLDEEGLDWDTAWNITVKTISYTNHTIMPEALEKWPVDTFKKLLPRIYMIVHEINERFCYQLSNIFRFDLERVSRMAIEAYGQIRMAYLAIVGSHATNGVAKVHSEILKHVLFRDFYEIYPERFSNKTNGITHRRWLLKSNPKLSGLITEAIGPEWIKEPMRLRLLDEKGFTGDSTFLRRMDSIKRRNKENLASFIWESNKVRIDPDSIFDVQVKRIHAYKRQLLMAMNIYNMYRELLENPDMDVQPRTFIFGGKAAPSYHLAKEIIKFISTISNQINNDARIKDKIKVVFLENYRVSLAEKIFPASEISEQISTASKEASGTGNMKFMMNGAVTLGTLDGANIEILEAVGKDNFIQFGLNVSEVLNYYKNQNYNSRQIYESDERIKYIIDNVINTKGNDIVDAEFPNIYESLITFNDEFFVLKDFDDYVKAQKTADALYRDRMKWLRMSAVNIAQSGIFSSDEVIKQYDKDIWGLSK